MICRDWQSSESSSEVNDVEKTKKPAIRFDGFTEDWELHKVADCLVERNEQSPQSNEYPLMAFIANEGIAPKGERYDRSSLISDAENKLYKRTEFGDFIYSSNNLTSGSIGLNKYGKASISPVYSIFYPSELAESDFIGRRFVRDDFISEMIKWRQGVVYGQWRIHESDFVRIDVHIPQKAEQIIIGKFLDDVDGLVFQHQQKYDKLLTFKKSMLEKMFPQNGAKVPEVRFAGFAVEWVEYRFGDIVTKYSDPVVTPTNGYTRLGIRSHGKGTFHSEVLPGMELETAQMHRVAANNFIVNITFGWEHAVAITNENDEGKLVSHRFPQYSFNEGIIPKFFKYLILDEKFRQHLELASPGGAGRNRVLKLDDMLEYQFMLPSVPEQESIADYLIKLDDLIQLKQSELEKLKNIKSALLEKMFV